MLNKQTEAEIDILIEKALTAYDSESMGSFALLVVVCITAYMFTH